MDFFFQSFDLIFSKYCILTPIQMLGMIITLFRPIAVLCGIDNILWNIPHIRREHEEYST